MTTTINASTSSGLVQTADTSGILQLQTANTAALTIDASQNVGIGTSSPGAKLDVVGANVVIKSNASSGYGSFYANGATGNAAYYFFAINGTETGRIYSDASNYIAFATGSSGTERMRIDSSGNVGIGTASPYGKFDVYSGTNRHLGIAAAATLTSGSKIESLNDAGTANVGMEFRASDWVWIATGTERMRIDTSGNVGIGKTPVGAMLDVNGAVKAGNGTAAATSYSFQGSSAIGMFTPDAGFSVAFSTGSTERMRIDSSGNVLVTNVAGLGYGTGSGGTVTQATSKSTAVTLNKPTGQITMNNAALASSAVVFFTFTNSLIGAADNLILTLTGGVTGVQNYQFWATTMASGSCTIAVKNISGGSLSEAVVFNFAIIKGATS